MEELNDLIAGFAAMAIADKNKKNLKHNTSENLMTNEGEGNIQNIVIGPTSSMR